LVIVVDDAASVSVPIDVIVPLVPSITIGSNVCPASVDILNIESIDLLSRGHKTQAHTTISKRLPFCFGDKINQFVNQFVLLFHLLYFFTHSNNKT
jgi:hypothetical protein